MSDRNSAYRPGLSVRTSVTRAGCRRERHGRRDSPAPGRMAGTSSRRPVVERLSVDSGAIRRNSGTFLCATVHFDS